MAKQKLELTWIGKDVRPRLEPRILLEDPRKSYHAARCVTPNDQFDNRLIFGDNLLALKALEQEFTGRVKCIYIDPPYNTGSAFEHYDDGLEHSLWLGMMRDRLELLWKLLEANGSLWINIDDIEGHYLKVLCDEVFGRRNFVANIVWQKRTSRENRAASRFPLLMAGSILVVTLKTENAPSVRTRSFSYERSKQMKDERPLWERLYHDEVYIELARIVGYFGLTYRDLVEKTEPLRKKFGQRVEAATYQLVTFEGQMTVNPPPLAKVTLRAEVRKLCHQLLGPAPETWDRFYRNHDGTPTAQYAEKMAELERLIGKKPEAPKKKPAKAKKPAKQKK